MEGVHCRIYVDVCRQIRTLAAFGIVVHFPSSGESGEDNIVLMQLGILFGSFTRPAMNVAVSHMIEGLVRASSK